MSIATTAAAHAATRIDLDGTWLLKLDPKGHGERSGWAAAQPAGARPVDVPSSWNVGPDHDYDGVAWYFRDVVLPAGVSQMHLDLHFGATFYLSHVWVNGVAVGSHEGGYTAYDLDVTHALHAGVNHVAVAIDNRPGFATIPGFAMRQIKTGSVWYDWWRNGGIVRPVSLVVSEDGWLRQQQIRSTVAPDLASADISIAPLVDNVSSRQQDYTLRSDVFAPDGTQVGEATATLHLEPGQTRAPALHVRIAHPTLWNVGAAQLYRVHTTLLSATGAALDGGQDEVGLRRIEIHDRRLFVNNHQVRLTGVSRHEDSPWEGLAETRGTILQDWDNLAALHVTLTRPVHYPQPPEVLDQADRDGILLIPEIPIWQMSEAQLANPKLRQLAAQMMTEMIAQDGNHPSIFAWSVCNESDARRPGGTAYVRGMKSLINRLDPGRFVTFADADVAASPWQDEAVLHDVDFIMANAYFGSWDGPADKIDPWLDFMDKTYPTKMVVVSEFGWVGFFSPTKAEADQARIANFEMSLDAFAKRPFVAGAILWDYQDYKSSRNLSPGETEGYVDHGLVDQNRQRKPSYFAWETRNRPATIDLAWQGAPNAPSGFVATIMPNGLQQLPSLPLEGYQLRWRMVRHDGTQVGAGEQDLPIVGSTVHVRGTWPSPQTESDGRLSVELVAPDGAIATRGELVDRRVAIGTAPFLPPSAEAH